MSTDLAASTIERLNARMQAGPEACLPELVRIVQVLSSDSQDISVHELAELVEKDVIVLAKVISAANMLGYNPSAVPITTVSQAIHVIGFNRVRTLATSLLLVEHAGRSCSIEDQRDMANQALCSGLIAQSAASHVGFVDPEQAFVCASLRNFGRMLMTTFLADDYKEALRLAESLGDSDEAFRRKFGLTPLEVGYQLLKSANLPETILSAVRECSPEALAAAEWPERQMLALADFSAKLSEATLDPHLTAEAYAGFSRELVAKFSAYLPFGADEVPDFVRASEEKFSHLMRRFGLAKTTDRGASRLRNRVLGIDPPRETRPAGKEAAPAAPGARFVLDPKLDLNSSLLEGLRRISAVRNGEEGMQLVREVLRQAFAPSDIVFFSCESPGVFAVRDVSGEFAESLRDRAVVRHDERSVFGICLSRMDNVVIHDASDARITPYLPDWIRGSQSPKALLLLPIKNRSKPSGLILATWKAARQIAIDAQQAKLLRDLIAGMAAWTETARW